jgi:hypothetical protein
MTNATANLTAKELYDRFCAAEKNAIDALDWSNASEAAYEAADLAGRFGLICDVRRHHRILITIFEKTDSRVVLVMARNIEEAWLPL